MIFSGDKCVCLSDDVSVLMRAVMTWLNRDNPVAASISYTLLTSSSLPSCVMTLWPVLLCILHYILPLVDWLSASIDCCQLFIDLHSLTVFIGNHLWRYLISIGDLLFLAGPVLISWNGGNRSVWYPGLIHYPSTLWHYRRHRTLLLCHVTERRYHLCVIVVLWLLAHFFIWNGILSDLTFIVS